MHNQWRFLRLVALSFLTLGLVLGLGLAASQTAAALNNGQALTPPMGWNSWNAFHCDSTFNETSIKQIADAMSTNGMQALGYNYINLDDCWQASRDSNGNIVANATRFPSGIAALAQYVHDRNLKFGLYTDVGPNTCQGYPGSLNHYQQDANTYASWKVDYIKVDWCNNSGLDAQTQYAQFRDALKNTNYPITFSICNWGQSNPWVWGPGTGNLWRTTGDISDNWGSMLGNFDASSNYAPSAGIGSWNDPDLLEVGNGGMTTTEDTTHFSLWALVSAPLITGNDLRSMSSTTKTILTNSEVIAVDQDSAGTQGTKVWDNGNGLQVWSKTLATSGQRAVILFNRGGGNATITARWSDIGLAAGSATVRDLWAHSDLGTFNNSYTATNIPSHGVVMLKISGSEAATTSYEAEASGNTLAGGAAVAACAACSGGSKVGFIGNNAGTLQFNSVNVNLSGSHIVTISYENGDPNRMAFVSVNGGSGIPIAFNSNGGWATTPGKKTLSLNLNAGSNTLKFYSSFGWSADIDKISVQDSPPLTPLVSGATYEISVKHSGLAVEVYGGTSNNGDAIDQWPYGGNTNQQWVITDIGGGVYKIINSRSGKALVVQNASASATALIIQYDYTSATPNNDQWLLQDAGGGYYQLINQNSNLALDMTQASQTPGTQFEQWYQTGGDNQKFLFTRLN
jgi:hypothetical protein